MNWYLINTKPNKEKFALGNLKRQGYICWFPEFKKSISHARQLRTVRKPYFPGYVFIKLDPNNTCWSSINSTYGVIKLLNFGGKPAIFSDKLFHKLQLLLGKDGLVDMDEKNFQVGNKVKIIAGPFIGMVGSLINVDAKNRVFILLNILGNNIKSSIDRKSIITL